MPQKYKSHVLRELAEKVVEQIAEVVDLTEEDRRDFPTSLVRQWITYDGHAALFLRDRQIYFPLTRTPLGKPITVPEPDMTAWISQAAKDWKISEDDLPDVFDQLNRGQSAEVTNADGIPVRLWVDPKRHSRHVEPLVKENIPPGRKRDYHKLAADSLEDHLGEGVDQDEMDQLVCSVVKQWQRYDGHASIFLEAKQLHFRITECGNGKALIETMIIEAGLDPELASLGFADDVMADVIARLNLGQEVEFRDRQGLPSLLWYDSREGGFVPGRSMPCRCGTASLRFENA